MLAVAIIDDLAPGVCFHRGVILNPLVHEIHMQFLFELVRRFSLPPWIGDYPPFQVVFEKGPLLGTALCRLLLSILEKVRFSIVAISGQLLTLIVLTDAYR